MTDPAYTPGMPEWIIRREAARIARELALRQGVHGVYRVNYTGESGGSDSRLVFDPNQTNVDGAPGWEFTTEDGEIVLPAGVFMLLAHISLAAVPTSVTYAVVDGDGNTGGGDGHFTDTVPGVGLSHQTDLTMTKFVQQDEPRQIYAQVRAAGDPIAIATCQIAIVKLG